MNIKRFSALLLAAFLLLSSCAKQNPSHSTADDKSPAESDKTVTDGNESGDTVTQDETKPSSMFESGRIIATSTGSIYFTPDDSKAPTADLALLSFGDVMGNPELSFDKTTLGSGDHVKIEFLIIQETYPSQIPLINIEILAKGTPDDIPEEISEKIGLYGIDIKELNAEKEKETEDVEKQTVSIEAASKTPAEVTLSDEFKSALADFSEKLYKTTVNDKGENTILSPLSVMYAYAYLSNAASGETLLELGTLFSSLDTETLNNSLYTLANEHSKTEKTTVTTANSVWANRDEFVVSDDFISVGKKYYSAEAYSESFAEKKTLDMINNWAEDKTDGMIKKVFNQLNPDWAAIILNSVLFDGVWEEKYSEDDIKKNSFKNYDGKETEHEFLYSTENTYFEVNGGAGFSKAYEDGYKFVAVLPNGDINEFVENMSVSEILSSSAKASGEVYVRIPKFEYDFHLDLKGPLKSLGLKKAFTESAELYGLSEYNSPTFISETFQDAKIILSEHGTKAAAVTVITETKASFDPNYTPPKRIYLTKPFFYMIVDKNNLPIFMGTVYSVPKA